MKDGTKMSMRSITENEKWHRYFAKWITISVIVGVVCGLRALALLEAIRIITQLTLTGIAGYSPLLAGGEGGTSGLVLSTVQEHGSVSSRLLDGKP